ncbi:Sugar kinase of the NBD/HSP70 family, may contain an N-terminal HTH domain [Andreprevotia lacus DSM 23236]|jgi:predicted NBD/HSP70 family sugar kinase|uniref:Sugar kinase of the NBD/HSP70 family, may contain an N-terminal HTH domain n=1 Tax=Andreprevotia lacus DSM 23236 TaxID=1121001 RepID=A0A1W1XLE8_9NEIS|nr:ROK family protein [Andreprevotia lacus]SMC24809.1 Sugar kinase of the NBD/HSP70 family, may contain an N-terminal HTH domain [Andreprevotia lacus DSM 23236]
MNLLAFDIGGTHLKYGIVTDTGEVIDARLADTEGAAGGAALLAKVVALAAPMVAQYAPAGIAVSSLGLIEPHTGAVLGAAEAVPGYAGLSVQAALESAYGLPVTVENDVNCVALAEGWLGAAKGVAHFLAIAVGTGIGGGIVIDGRLYRGHRAAAGEWGYMKIAGKLWEDHASMRGLVNSVTAQTGVAGWDGRKIFAACDEGDAQLQAVVAEWLELLATGIANLIYAFNPERVVIGGGIAGRGEPFRSELDAAINRVLLPDFQQQSQIVLASAGNHAGMMGAARNWFLTKRFF